MNFNASYSMNEAQRNVLTNPYQGYDRKVLFVCTVGILRSATAARIYSKKYNTRCAGTDSNALIPLTQLLVYWADEIVFMEKYNYNTACANFDKQTFDYKCKVLDIDDSYAHMNPALIKKLKSEYGSTIKIKNEVNRCLFP